MNQVRKVDAEADAEAITRIYNPYVTDTTISFENEPLTVERMKERIADLSGEFPYYVSLDDDGRVTGFCYAHPWKARVAYNPTLETTIYLAPEAHGRGMGRALMERLIADCRERGFVSLIACITADNLASCRFHESLGFSRVSFFRSVGLKFGRLLDVVDYQLML